MNKCWSIMARRSGREWVEVCRCDTHPEHLCRAMLRKGYDEVYAIDRRQKFIGKDGTVDLVAAMTEIIGLNPCGTRRTGNPIH